MRLRKLLQDKSAFLRVAASTCCILFGLLTNSSAQQGSGVLRGRVTDELGKLILNATVTLTASSGNERTARASSNGIYTFNKLPPGRYQLRVSAPGFAPYRDESIEIIAGRQHTFHVRLSITLAGERVTVRAEGPLSIEPDENVDSIIRSSLELDALTEDAESLLSALNALAGPAAGSGERQLIVDGFTGNQMPPKQSISEVRIGQDPFSAENERMGAGRIEILTKPGTDKVVGSAFFNFNDESLNSRNPFSPNRASFQLRQYGGTFSGPLSSRRAAIFLDLERREADDNAVVSATVLDAALSPTLYSRSVLKPQRRFTLSPRLDYQLNAHHTLTARYRWTRTAAANEGVGGFSLPERAFRTETSEHLVQLAETAILRPNLLVETRSQFIRQERRQQGDNSVPAIMVLDAFTGGGAQVGLSFNRRTLWEFQGQAFLTHGRHALRAGGRWRGVRVADFTPYNFGGTFIFSGGLAAKLDERGQVLLVNGAPVFEPITSLERYRRTLLLLRQGLPDNRGALGGPQLGFGPTQLTIADGNPEARVGQMDIALFLQDDWRLKPNLTLSGGLRYEAQSNISHLNDFAPRVGFSWSPLSGNKGGNSSSPRMVLRGGFGIFYERYSENYILQQRLFNGRSQQQYIVTDPTLLSLFPRTPTGAALSVFAIPQTIRRVAPDIRAPYSLQSSLSIERRLPLSTMMSATYLVTRSLHVLRSRNINAPLPGTYVPGVGASGIRPLGNIGNVFQYESSGRFNQQQLRLSLNSRLNKSLSVLATYVLTRARSDTDGASSFPADSYELDGEYGRSSNDIRHHFSLSGTVNAPWKLRFSPFIVATSGSPFNITTGWDANGDTLFTERPAFAVPSTRPRDLRETPFGRFDLNPAAGAPLIPRNYGTGPRFFLINLRASRTITLGEARAPGGRSKAVGQTALGKHSSAQAKWWGGRAYNLTLSVQIQNLLNNINLSTPSGNLRSTYFGRSNSLARGYGYGDVPTTANRRIEFQVQLSF